MQRGIMRPLSLFLGSDVLEGVQYKRHNFKRKKKNLIYKPLISEMLSREAAEETH